MRITTASSSAYHIPLKHVLLNCILIMLLKAAKSLVKVFLKQIKKLHGAKVVEHGFTVTDYLQIFIRIHGAEESASFYVVMFSQYKISTISLLQILLFTKLTECSESSAEKPASEGRAERSAVQSWCNC